MAEMGQSHESHLLHLAALLHLVPSGTFAISLDSEISWLTLDIFESFYWIQVPIGQFCTGLSIRQSKLILYSD